jgi:hypothetical protein
MPTLLSGREVGEEAGALPVRETRQQHPVEVAEDVGERLAAVGRARRQRGADVARLDAREHRQLVQPAQVAVRPVERGLAVLAEAHARSLASDAGAPVDDRPALHVDLRGRRSYSRARRTAVPDTSNIARATETGG